jgi:CubicO group peptidase (beta-lactamase class C family)
MMRTTLKLLFVLLLTAAPLLNARQAVTPADLTSALALIDAHVASEFARDGVGSVTVGVIDKGAVVWTRSHGYADMEAKRPATRESVYRIGSITKQFTALMLLQLAEQGKVRLSDPLEQYVPEASQIPKLSPSQPPITLAQVASMTSGLAREPEASFSDHSVGPVSGWDRKVLTFVPRTRYAHEPGTRYLYSNIGYAMLGVALQRAAGEPFTQYVEKRIVAPLGMTSTAFEPDASLRARIARGYVMENGKPSSDSPVRELDGRGYRVPNGALFSTVDDLAKFLAFELGEGPAIVKKETLDAWLERLHSGRADLGSGYGLGLQAVRRGPLVALGHGGSTAGYRAQALIDRTSRFGVVVLRSAEGKINPQEIALRALELVAATRGKPDVRKPS